jgi:hypothetical protein
MTFQLPDLTVLALTLYVVAGATLLVMAAGATVFVATNRRERLARHEDLRTYYGHLVLAS